MEPSEVVYKNSNYFKDGKSVIDYVLVVDASIDGDAQRREKISRFIDYMRNFGIKEEMDKATIPKHIYIKLHLSSEAIQHFSNLYNIDIFNEGHNYLPFRNIFWSCFTTVLTKQQRDLYRRKEGATSKERIMIMKAVLDSAIFGDDENMQGLEKLIKTNCIKTAYPLHDADTDGDQDPSDRQLLSLYWANFGLWYKEQPLNLIEKYYGSEIAFYFAWCGFYNMMLIPAAIVGVVCTLAGFIKLLLTEANRVKEICTSNLVMCPACYIHTKCVPKSLATSCYYTKLSFLFDNTTTVFFAVFMSFWATLFLNLWSRFENVLKIRWNVEMEEVDTKLRLEHIESIKQKRMSKITGELELYMPASIIFLKLALTFSICLLLLMVVILAVTAITTYRIIASSFIKMSSTDFLKNHVTIMTMTTSCILQVIFIKLFGKVLWYGKIAEYLTRLENPRTQTEFDKSIVYKRYFLAFVNNYSALFYIAFIKGHFYLPTADFTTTLFASDVCHPSGCLMGLCIQLAFLLLFKSFLGNILTLLSYQISKLLKNKEMAAMPQWEEEFNLNESGPHLLTADFLEMIIQYGFVTLFVAAFPLAPLCALLNNILELRLDAYKLVKTQRRPVAKMTAGIKQWDGIITSVTYFSTVVNAFVLGFTSDFIPREIYKITVDWSLKGFVGSTLSKFNPNDHKNLQFSRALISNSTFCYYRGKRYSPDHPLKYRLTPHFWREMGMRLLCVILFEHILLTLNGILSYAIPDVPASVKESLNRERSLQREMRLKMLDKTYKEIIMSTKTKLENQTRFDSPAKTK